MPASELRCCASLSRASPGGDLGNTDNAATVLEMREVQAAANTLGLDVVRLEIRRAEEIASALEPLKGPALALYVVIDAVTNDNALQINTFALAARLPTMHGPRERSKREV